MIACDTSSHIDWLLRQQMSRCNTWLRGYGEGREGGEGARRGWEGYRKGGERRDSGREGGNGGGEKGSTTIVTLYHRIVDNRGLWERARWRKGLVREKESDSSNHDWYEGPTWREGMVC